MSRDARGPELYLSAEGQDVRAICGDALRLDSNEVLTVRADVRGGSGLLLRLVTQQGVVHEAPILADDFRVEYMWTEAGEQALEGPAYIRAEVIRDPGPEVDLREEPSALWLEAMCNPIYVLPPLPAPAEAHTKARVESRIPVTLHAHP
jgi:hypothetical protein